MHIYHIWYEYSIYIYIYIDSVYVCVCIGNHKQDLFVIPYAHTKWHMNL